MSRSSNTCATIPRSSTCTGSTRWRSTRHRGLVVGAGTPDLVVVAAERGIARAGPAAAGLAVVPDDHVAAHLSSRGVPLRPHPSLPDCFPRWPQEPAGSRVHPRWHRKHAAASPPRPGPAAPGPGYGPAAQPPPQLPPQPAPSRTPPPNSTRSLSCAGVVGVVVGVDQVRDPVGYVVDGGDLIHRQTQVGADARRRADPAATGSR